MGLSAGLKDAIVRWRRRRRSVRAQRAYEAWNLRERYGPAAYAIARNSARQPGGAGHRRFWLGVAAQLRRAPSDVP